MSLTSRAMVTFWLLAVITCTRATAGTPSRIVVTVASDAAHAGDIRDGVALGAAEIGRAAELLRRQVEFVWASGADGGAYADAAVLVAAPAAGALDGARLRRPVVLVTGADEPPRPGPSMFVVSYAAEGYGSPAAADGCGPGIVTAWDRTFERYGAGELNERFERAYRRSMTPAAWAGWVAAKAVGEAVLRSDDASPAAVERTLRSLRFDGHKGRALYFGPDGRLVHPRYILRACADGPRIEEARGQG